MPDRGDRDDDEIDDASLSSMRSVWLSMRDEDPPAAGMSALMAAAAAKAKEMQPEPAWWQRAFAQLRRPPALAFATVMILIGGAVLVTRNQDKMKVEEPPPAAELRVQEPPVIEQPPAAEAPVIVAEPAPEPVAEPPPVKEVKPRAKPTPKPPRDEKLTFDGDKVGPNEPTRDRRFEAADEPKSVGGGEAVTTAPGIVDAPKQPEATKPTEEALDSTVTITGNAPAKNAQTPPNEQLARQAESAASRGDCAAVRTIVARMRKQDEAFYKSRLGKNAAVTKCL